MVPSGSTPTCCPGYCTLSSTTLPFTAHVKETHTHTHTEDAKSLNISSAKELFSLNLFFHSVSSSFFTTFFSRQEGNTMNTQGVKVHVHVQGLHIFLLALRT